MTPDISPRRQDRRWAARIVWLEPNGYTARPFPRAVPSEFIVSKQDTHFFNVFSLLIGLLVAIAVCLFALARIVASQTQDRQVLTEADYAKNVATRIAPPSQEAVSGQDNAALAIKATTPAAAGAAAAIPKNGTELFEQTCSACH